MDRAVIENLIGSRLTIKQIAFKQNCSETTVRYWLKKFGLKTARGPHGKLPKDLNNIRTCSNCGESNPNKFYGHKKTICGKCQNRYATQKGREKREFIVEKLGGKCVVCGFNKYKSALDTHHLHPEEKDVAWKTSRGWKIEKIIKELEKCVLLCKNCHSAIHNNELQLGVG